MDYWIGTILLYVNYSSMCIVPIHIPFLFLYRVTSVIYVLSVPLSTYGIQVFVGLLKYSLVFLGKKVFTCISLSA